MTFLLCHDCYSWVEPINDRCPACQSLVLTSSPDLPERVLQELIGDEVHRLGEVRVERRLLPDTGFLYATERGLCFVPHRVDQESQLIVVEDVESSVMWSLASLAFTPLVVVLPFVKKKGLKEKQVSVLRPPPVKSPERSRLPELLMQNPGVFFIPRGSIRRAGRRWNRWRIDRTEGFSMKFSPIRDRRSFHVRVAECVESGSWTETIAD